jgi:hypothetical protein
MAAGPGLKPIPPASCASGIRARPPTVKPNPVTVRSSSPGTGLDPVTVTAAKPAAASRAMPALARTAVWLNPDGSPTSRARPVTASPVVAAANRPVRRPVTRSAPSTMTGAVPIVTRVASGTEVSDTATK